MKLSKLTRKEREVNRLKEEVQHLKQQIDTRSQEIAAVRAELRQFEAQYDLYVQSLHRQREELEIRIQDCRFQLQSTSAVDLSVQSQGEAKDEDIGKSEQDAPPGQQETDVPLPLIESIEPTDTAAEQQRKQIRNFFAQFWHPDKRWSGASPDLELMRHLNVAFKESDDEVGLLITIPWHEVWLQAGEQESIGDQWARLTDWHEALEAAQERVEGLLAELTQHEFYTMLQEKKRVEQEGVDYLARLASREREEIARLEQTLEILLQQVELRQCQEDEEAADE